MFNTLPPCRDQDHIYLDILILGHLYHHSWSQPSWSTPPSRQCSPVASLAIGRYHLLHIDQHDHFDHDHHGHLHHNHLHVDHHHWSPESKVIPILTNSTSWKSVLWFWCLSWLFWSPSWSSLWSSWSPPPQLSRCFPSPRANDGGGVDVVHRGGEYPCHHYLGRTWTHWNTLH